MTSIQAPAATNSVSTVYEGAGESVNPPMIVRAANAGGFVRTNPAFRDRTGYDATELATEHFLHWVDPEDHALVQAAINDGEGRCRVRHRTRDGSLVPIDIQITEQENESMVLGRFARRTKHTEFPGAGSKEEATVRGTLEMIARIVEEQNPGYKCSILLVSDGRFVSGAGPSLPDEYNAAIDGYAVGPTVGSCGTAIYWNVPVIVEDIQADPLWRPFAVLAEKAGVAACWSHPFVSTSGNVLGALALYAPEPRTPTDEQLGRLRAAARMTGLAVERGRAEEALREKRKRELELEEQLRQAAKMEALGVLAGGVAHDFNNVLATILANAEFASEVVPPESEVVEMLSSIIEASRRAGEFCQQMLAYAGRGSLKTSRIEVGALIRELSCLVFAAVPKKATLEYSLHDSPIYVEGDENQLLQVVMNLVTNAADALNDGEGQIVVGSELAYYDTKALRRLDPQADLPAGEYVRITVRDTGSGMDAETIARIFDPFFTTKFTGRGLGLSAAKGIIAKHCGVIQLDSKKGEGTTFTIALPTIPTAKKRESIAAIAAASARARVLVVDDEAPLRAILSRRLKHHGFDVVEAADGQQAVDVFREQTQSFDCVLLDVSMPKRSGEEVLEELRGISEHIPVVLMSGFSEGELLTRFKGAKLAGTLQKPVAADRLLAAIQNATGADDSHEN